MTCLIIVLISSGFIFIYGALTGLLLLVFAVFALQAAFSIKEWIALPLSALMIIFLVWLVLVKMLSTVPTSSLLTAWTLAGLPIAYLTWPMISNSAAIWLRLRAIFWLAGVCMASWALWQVIRHIGNGQAVGPLMDRNAFAALINLFWFPAAYLLLSSSTAGKRGLQLLLGMGLFVMSSALFATESRGGIATWLLLLPVLLWAGYRHPPFRPLVFVIPFIALAAYLSSAQIVGTNVANRTYDLAQDPSTNARLFLWKSTIQMIAAHPFAGTGWGTFAAYYPTYRSPLESISSGLFSHNDYLQLAAEGGIPALVLQLGILLGLLFQLKRSLKRVGDLAGLESVALILGALAIFIQAGVNFIFYFAFMNILAGLYLARAAQLVEQKNTWPFPSVNQVSRPIKNLLAGFVGLMLAAPLFIHLFAQLFLTGTQPGLKAVILIAPRLNSYDIAKLISAIRPQEGIAQEVMLQSAEHGLNDSDGIIMQGGNFKRELLNEALERFDFIRSQTANNANVGVREVKVLLEYPNSFGQGVAYAKAKQVLDENLRVNPYHAYSWIYLARLQAAQGRRVDAFNTLRHAEHSLLNSRDRQLIAVEILRQYAAPKVIAELDDIEKQLRNVRSESETGKALMLSPHFSEDIDVRLEAIGVQLRLAKQQGR
jgi:hypothetical protein